MTPTSSPEKPAAARPSTEARSFDDFIIERPRLLKLLDDADTRMRMLIAPAGYGKTTLARQWMRHLGAPNAWYVVGPEGGDVAAVAARIGAACEQIVPGCSKRMLTRLSSSANPESESEAFGLLLADELAEWPREAWLVIDDYHELASGCDSLVECLVNQTDIQVLLTSRSRPTWAKARTWLYGYSSELGKSELLMTESETAEVLVACAGSPGPSLVRAAHGWPAVVALMARSAAQSGPIDAESLHRYLSEEVLELADRQTQSELCQLAAAARLNHKLICALYGDEKAEALVSVGYRLGLMSERDGEPTVHPLFQSFLEQRLRREPRSETLVVELAECLIELEDWDSAWSLAQSFHRVELIPRVIARALPSLMLGRRLSTLRSWIVVARSQCGDSAIVDLAEAELALLSGAFPRSQACADQAVRKLPSDSDLMGHALRAAGRAARYLERTSTALALYERSLAHERSQEGRIEGLLGAFYSANELEDMQLRDGYLSQLAEFNGASPDATLRVGTAHLAASVIGGDPGRARHTWGHALSLLEDGAPIARVNFALYYVENLILTARYAEACALADAALQEAIDQGHACSIGWALAMKAAVEQGLRRLKHADLLLARAKEHAEAEPTLAVHLEATRLLNDLCKGTIVGQEPRLMPSEIVSAQPHAQGLYLACLGLASLVSEDDKAAVAYSKRAADATVAVDAATMARLVLGVADWRSRQDDGMLLEAFGRARSIGCFHPLVMVYRACPDIIPLLAQPDGCAEMAEVMLRANDLRLAERHGVAVASGKQVEESPLSPRETEILSLLAEGLSNIEIGRRLFISDVTVKVHLRHIYDKLGVRNRSEAILHAVHAS